MNNILKTFVFVWFVATCILAAFSLIKYPGHWYIFILFTLVLNGLLITGFTKDSIFFDTFIGILFWFGFWLKFSVRLVFMEGKFHEPVGYFNGSGSAYDNALTVVICGVTALLGARFIRKKYFFSYLKNGRQRKLEGIFQFYKKYRTVILILFLIAISLVGCTNIIFGIYQRGSVPRTILPFGLNGIYTWLLVFGLTVGSAVLLDCEFRLRENPYVVTFISLTECFISNVSMLSRGMILNGSALLTGILKNEKSKKRGSSRLIYYAFISAIFIFLMLFSIISVNHMRLYSFYTDKEVKVLSGEPETVINNAEAKSLPRNLVEDKSNNTRKISLPASIMAVGRISKTLFLDRWVGMESVMAVTSYPYLGWDIWKKAWQERFSHSGTSLYDLTFTRSTQYVYIDVLKHHFISLPGILAFFYYPGSYLFLFFTMLCCGFMASLIEGFVYKISGSNIILSAVVAETVAYRYSSFGYAPRQSYLFFGSIIINVIVIYFLNKILIYKSGHTFH